MKKILLLGMIICIISCGFVKPPLIGAEDSANAADTVAQRFTDNLNGTVTDNLTGLIWLKNANCADRKLWDDAMEFCKTLVDGECGLKDGSSVGQWRLPSQEELKSLVDSSLASPSIPAGNPFENVQSNYYWSSSKCGDPKFAWYVFMPAGVTDSNTIEYSTYYVWPVRGGKGN